MGEIRRLLLERRGVSILVGMLVAGWLVFIFAGALNHAEEVDEIAAQLRQDNAELQRRVEAGRGEMEWVRKNPFLDLQARAYGFGSAGERSFALPDDAPSPPPLELLGAGTERAATRTPLDEWLDLLFGA